MDRAVDGEALQRPSSVGIFLDRHRCPLADFWLRLPDDALGSAETPVVLEAPSRVWRGRFGSHGH